MRIWAIAAFMALAASLLSAQTADDRRQLIQGENTEPIDVENPTMDQARAEATFDASLEVLRDVANSPQIDPRTRGRARGVVMIMEVKRSKGELFFGCLNSGEGDHTEGQTNFSATVTVGSSSARVMDPWDWSEFVFFSKDIPSDVGRLAGVIVHECTHVVQPGFVPIPVPPTGQNDPTQLQLDALKKIVGGIEVPAYCNQEGILQAIEEIYTNSGDVMKEDIAKQAKTMKPIVSQQKEAQKKNRDC